MKNLSPTTERKSLTVMSNYETIWPVTSFKLFISICTRLHFNDNWECFLFWNQNFCLQIKKQQKKLTAVYITENDSTRLLFQQSEIQCTYLEWITNWHYPELRGYFTLKSLLHSGLKQVMSLFTLGSARAVLAVALVYSFPDVLCDHSIDLPLHKPAFYCSHPTD